MAEIKKDIRKIAGGSVLLLLAASAAAAAFYFLEAKPRWEAAKPAPAVPPAGGGENASVETTAPLADGKNKKEGFLWMDAQTSQIVITLGEASGLVPGGAAAVYDGSEKIGEVIVDKIFETVSYAHPVRPSMNLSVKGYYRVVIE